MFHNSNIKQKILKNSCKLHKNRFFQDFLEWFCFYVPIEEKEIAEFATGAQFIFGELLNKFNKVSVIAAKILDDKETVILSLINKDMPFIVDSITEFLSKKKYKVERMINAVICVERNSKGEVISIKKSEEQHLANESVIYLKLSIPNHGDNLKKLIGGIEDILKDVRVAYQDWKLILNKLDDACIGFESDPQRSEDLELLTWIKNNNFTFLAYSEYDFKNDKFSRSSSLGVIKSSPSIFHGAILEDVFGANGVDSNHCTETLIVGKVSELSKVHRYTNLDYVCVLLRDKGKLIRALVFLGLFSSRIGYQSVNTIPLIKSKVQWVLKNSGFNVYSFNYKELLNIIETFPRDEIFQLSEKKLFDMSMRVLASLHNPKLLFFAEDDKCRFFVNLLVFFPRSRVTSDIVDKIQRVINSNIKGKFINSNLRLSIMGIAYVHISMKIINNAHFSKNIVSIEKQLENATRRWDEKFDIVLEDKFGLEKSKKLFEIYKQAFPIDYQLRFSVEDAVDDIFYLDLLEKDQKPLFNLYQNKLCNQKYVNLKIYNLESKLDLHKIMPIIENLGFSTIEENVFRVNSQLLDKPMIIQDFSLLMPGTLKIEGIKQNIESTIQAIFADKINNDHINQLALTAGFSWREIFLIDSYCRYMLQIKFAYSQFFIRSVLVKNYSVTKHIVELFFAMFKPDSSDEDLVGRLHQKIQTNLLKISSSGEDRVLRKFLELVANTIRTNFFQRDKDDSKYYLSLKFCSKNISDIPSPKPYAEIFVCSSEMEGVHLRSDKISRGGIRWSDRVEDYRTEVLGLMKAQMTKNAIIVPDGAKGGFLVKNQSQFISPDDIFAAGLRCYKTLLRGMLDITDNLIEGKIVKPRDVICFDDDDPYLVVAADKGTATFSDTANEIAHEYNFWLGDAFASGGKFGYDHKKMGITARGSWISVRGHFSKLGIDPEVNQITVIGIGDMSGDVFGNGLLLSKTLKLVAAFNHIHIFLDPNPNPLKSYNERLRLFNMPRSQWTDYNPALISKGGGVFLRDTKSIKLSAEIKSLLDISLDSVDPDTLIRSILKAKVDLLWNGGIGTYVKSESETHAQIENKSNDNVRVNGKELRCKVVGEGGNLGFTQLGRVEYAINRGSINTDFIDNSGGVDCSDHEVNIKIALGEALVNKKLTKKDRDRLLVSMQVEVSNLVLADNLAQDQSISISERKVFEDFDSYKRLIAILEEKVGLDCKLEFLPSSSELLRRYADKLALTRPELAVLSSYSKKAVYLNLILSMLPHDNYYERSLLQYFPTKMRSNYFDYILKHPLKKEIIATVVANNIINHTGIDFFHLAQDYTGLKGCDIARAYSIVWHIFGLEKNMAKN
jgi:glutamate dehydrogenase